MATRPNIGHDHGVLHDSTRRLSIDFHYLEKMPMDVHGMRVVGPVAKENAIFRARAKHKFVLVRIFLAVDGPVVESFHASGDLLDNHVDRFGRRILRLVTAENRDRTQTDLVGRKNSG